jgi:hypothetical protein
MLPEVRDEIAGAGAHAASSAWFERFARCGFAAKGVVFAVIGVKAARVAFGEVHEEADAPGAIETIGAQPLSAVLLVILAIGLLGYALWRFAQAFLDVEDEGRDASGLAQRAIYFGIGATYAAFATVCILVLTGWRRDNDNGVQDVTAWAMTLPLGNWLVALAGAVVILAGLRELFIAVTGRFKQEFARERMSSFEQRAARWIGWYGHAARGGAFVIAGSFAIRAALVFDPDEAPGLSPRSSRASWRWWAC